MAKANSFDLLRQLQGALQELEARSRGETPEAEPEVEEAPPPPKVRMSSIVAAEGRLKALDARLKRLDKTEFADQRILAATTRANSGESVQAAEQSLRELDHHIETEHSFGLEEEFSVGRKKKGLRPNPAESKKGMLWSFLMATPPGLRNDF